MKKNIIYLFVILLMANFLWSDLKDDYKKGRINLKTVESFGKNTKWENYFYEEFKWLTVSPGPNYSIFVANLRQHSIFKFDKNGNFQKKFGQKGLGPTDVNGPQFMTFLDNKYLIISDSVVHRRFTIWGLDGNFIDVVRTRKSPFIVTALKNNILAYWTFSQYPSPKNGNIGKIQVILKDIKTRKEKVIREIALEKRSSIKLTKNISTNVHNFVGEVFTVQTIDGNLAVGVSNQPEIKIYSPDGENIREFKLINKPIAVDSQYIEKYKASIIDQVTKELKETTNETKKFYHKLKLQVFPKYDFSKIFLDHLPFYKEILVDSDGNFIFFKYSDCLKEKDCKTIFQVYSPKGEFICETELDTGIFDIKIDPRFRTLCFTSDGIIGYATEKGDEEEGSYKLFKSNY